jgi:hypothetical protein
MLITAGHTLNFPVAAVHVTYFIPFNSDQQPPPSLKVQFGIPGTLVSCCLLLFSVFQSKLFPYYDDGSTRNMHLQVICM